MKIKRVKEGLLIPDEYLRKLGGEVENTHQTEVGDPTNHRYLKVQCRCLETHSARNRSGGKNGEERRNLTDRTTSLQIRKLHL